LIANAIGSQEDLAGAFSNVGYLIAANLVGYTTHFFFTDVFLHYLLTRKNPFTYLKHIVPAQTTALACASSAATLPVTLKCVKSTGVVPDDIRTFVLPLGATVNMDGSAIYFPCACIWLAILNGIEPNVGSYILLIILSTVGSAGAAPVPASGLVLVITAYNTVFGGSGIPNGFEFVVAIDWFLDRLITVLNVTGDTVVAHIVACRTPWKDNDSSNKTTGTKIVESGGGSSSGDEDVN
jgi:Na+/H+-dicarboxylate symporter